MHPNIPVTEKRDWLITFSSQPASTVILAFATAHEAFLYGLSHRTPGVEEFITIMEMDDPEVLSP